MAGCSLCGIPKAGQPGIVGGAVVGQGGAPTLFAADPLLRDHVADVLGEQAIAFRQSSGVFTFPSSVPYAEVMNTLRIGLSQPEKRDLRVVRETSTQANRFHHELARFDTPWFANALDQDRFVYHLQPIVDVYNVQAYAYEGLIRLFSDRAYSGGEIIAAAQQRAVLRQFDTYSRIRAIRSIAPQLPAGVKVFVNFLPARIYNPDYCLQSTLLAVDELGIPHSSIVFEAVQSGQIRNIPDLLKIRDFFGKHGFGFALDNASVSQQSLDTLQAVIPDFIKLDMSLSSELSGTAQQNATRALIESARSTGVEVIAEGVETVVQARFLRRLGVRLMQGWYWGKPGPLVLKDSAELAPLCAAVNHPEPQSTSRDSSPGTTHSPDPPLVFA